MSPVIAWICCDKAFLSPHTFSTDEELLTHQKCLLLPKHARNSHLCWLNDEVVAQSYGQHLATYITLTLPQVVNAYCTLVARSRNLEKV